MTSLRLAFAAALLLARSLTAATVEANVSDGVADLTQTTITDSQELSLDGQWKFYWQDFIPADGSAPKDYPINLQVRGTWKNADYHGTRLPATGWGSYALLLLVGNAKGDLALRMPNVGTAYTLYANGEQIASTGTPASDRAQSVARTQPQIVRLPPPDSAGRILLVVHVSNFEDRHGGIWQTVRLGRAEHMLRELNNSFAMAAFLFGAIFLIGLHHFFMFARRRSEKSNLAFALLCILFALRPLVEGNRYLLTLVPELPWTVNSRLAYLTFYAAVPLSAWFLRLVFPRQFHIRAFFTVLAISVPASLAVVLLPARYYSETLSAFQLFALAMIVYSIYTIVVAVRRGERGAKTLAVGLAVLFAGATIDILTVANILNWPDVSPFGLIGFILSQSVLLSLRQEDAYQNLEALAQENRALISSMEIKILDRTAEIAELSAEGDAVLDALTEGVFLIGRDQAIGNKISRKVVEMLEIEADELTQKPFSQVILHITGSEISEDARLFLNVLFNPNMDDETVEQLNPLSRLVIRGLTSQQTRILQFTFTRQWRQKRIMAAFVSCRDITADERMREEIAEREVRAQKQLEIVRTLFSVNPEALQAFYGSIETELEDVDSALSPESDLAPEARIEKVYRAAHTIKGSAQLFKVDFIAGEAHAFEDRLQELLKRGNIENIDLLGVNLGYTELQQALEEFEAMILKILKFQKEASGMHVNAVDMLREALPRMVAETAEKLGKKAEIKFTNFSPELIPRRLAATLRDSLVQSVRNALAHSIEMPARRKELAKRETGLIEISVEETENTLFIKVRDDGSSFDIPRIRMLAAEKALATAAEIETMPDHEIVNFIFEQGFSTVEAAGSVAGRGAGMNVIAAKIRQAGGKIRIQWGKEQFTEFTFVLPKK